MLVDSKLTLKLTEMVSCKMITVHCFIRSVQEQNTFYGVKVDNNYITTPLNVPQIHNKTSYDQN